MCTWLAAGELYAADPAVDSSGSQGLGTRAMSELFELQVPAKSRAKLAAASSANLGYIEPLGDVHGVARFGGQVALAYSPVPQLSLGLDFRGRFDTFPGSEEGLNGVGEPRITAQTALLESREWQLGLAAQVRFVGSAAPSISWESTSPALRVLVARSFGPKTKVVFNLGFDLDRSLYSVPQFDALSDADRITLGISQVPTLPVGFGVSTLMGRAQHEVLVELFGRPGLGDGAPSVFESPWSLRAGMRPRILAGLSGLAAIEFGLSLRGDGANATLIAPIESRVALLLGFIWAPVREHDAPPVPVPSPVVAPPPPAPVVVKPVQREVVLANIEGRVVGEAGQGVPNADVRVSASGKWLATTTTDTEGNFKLAKLPEGSSYEVMVEAPDFDLATVTVSAGIGHEILLYQALPRGAIEGRVTDYAGAAVAAEVQIGPGGLKIVADADGRFQVELAPGKYTLTFVAPEFRSETRVVQVEDKGVFIQNLALRR